MGDNVIDDAQVIFEQETDDGSYSAGGQTGKVILNSVTLTIERPTNGYSGLGNEGEVAVGYGTRSAAMDHEEMLNEEAASLLADLYNNARTPTEVSIIAGDVLDASAAKFDWNELELSHEDDGDQMVSISGKVRGLDIESNP
jgi:hypothetical protein